jgi:hypothetical protein
VPPTASPSPTLRRAALTAGAVAAAIIPINSIALVFTWHKSVGVVIFIALALAQLFLGMTSGFLGLLYCTQLQRGSRGRVMVLSIVGMLVGLGGLVPLFLLGAILLVGGSH